MKYHYNRGIPESVHFYRDQQGNKIDFQKLTEKTHRKAVIFGGVLSDLGVKSYFGGKK
jgi:hypothetical protein